MASPNFATSSSDVLMACANLSGIVADFSKQCLVPLNHARQMRSQKLAGNAPQIESSREEVACRSECGACFKRLPERRRYRKRRTEHGRHQAEFLCNPFGGHRVGVR